MLDETAFQFFVSRPGAERRKLFAGFEQLRDNPYREADHQTKDSTGRSLNVWACRPFLVTYWVDSFVSEIRVVDIERVRFQPAVDGGYASWSDHEFGRVDGGRS